MTLYVVKNNTSSDLTFLDTGGILRQILPGSSGTYDISASVYTSLVANVGSANVVPLPFNTFRYAVVGYTPVATPTDILMIQGSSLVTRVNRISLFGFAGTTAGFMPAALIRRSTQFTTQGSAVFTALTAAKMDTQMAAATAVVSTIGTANLTSVGTAVATVGAKRLPFSSATVGLGGATTWDFSATAVSAVSPTDNPVVLRGTSDFLFINLQGAAVPSGGVIDIEIETTEYAV
jgi:hypothetical protein